MKIDKFFANRIIKNIVLYLFQMFIISYTVFEKAVLKIDSVISCKILFQS